MTAAIPPNICIERTTCRICGSSELRSVLDLGDQHIAGQFVQDVPPDYLLQRYPLELIRCASNTGCGLVQLKHSIAPSAMYVDYGYHSGINETMCKHLAGIAATAERLVSLKPGDTVVDIGCNDGTLLLSYSVPGIDRIGFDPAESVARLAREKHLHVVFDYFSQHSFLRARPTKRAKIVTSIAMFYDLEDPGGFVKDVAAILADDGVWVMELSYMPLMLEKNSFDTICHEHLEYYALGQVEWMLERAGLRVHRIEFNDINGGSFRVYIRKSAIGAVPTEDENRIQRIREREKALSLKTELPYQRFREAVLEIKLRLKSLVERCRQEDQRVYVYGASTKGNTILEFCELDSAVLPKAAERNPIKWGRRTLGTNIPIISEQQARSERPDYFLVLPWHFFPEFAQREVEFLARGGKFILPLPEVRVVGQQDVLHYVQGLFKDPLASVPH
jgi:NDP-4-keto-2,6-dideoxyhexose 3-C-methyltransferase